MEEYIVYADYFRHLANTVDDTKPYKLSECISRPGPMKFYDHLVLGNKVPAQERKPCTTPTALPPSFIFQGSQRPSC